MTKAERRGRDVERVGWKGGGWRKEYRNENEGTLEYRLRRCNDESRE